VQAIHDEKGRPPYPVFTCSDAVAAHQIAIQAKGLSGSHARPLWTQALHDAMALRYSTDDDCTTATLRKSELQYAKSLSEIAYKHQVRNSLR
jgi:hypothetical protein